MAENFKVVRECRRLEANMNVHLQIRTLRSEIFPMIQDIHKLRDRLA